MGDEPAGLKRSGKLWDRGTLFAGCAVPGRVGTPNVEKFLVTRRLHRDVLLACHAVQRRAQILHLLSVQTAERNLDRLRGLQLGEVGENVGHGLSMFAFAALWNIGSIHRHIVSIASASFTVSSHGALVVTQRAEIVPQKIVPYN